MAQGSEEPPFLRVGTEVSAKYRGAFCEASIKIVKKLVKCKIQYKDNTSATLTDDVVKGDLKVGSNVEIKTPDGRIMDGIIIKLTDASTYTVVFDDGDERTLRRSSLCLKGERHFNESETLDHLPLTDPENFGTPVMQNGKKRKKRRPSNQQSSSMEDAGSEKEYGTPIPSKKKCLFNDSNVGKVVVVECGTKRKSHWFPALGVSPSQENMTYIKSKDQCLVRSFKDGNYHVISVKDTKEFSKGQDPVCSALKTDNRASKPAIERAVAYLETGRVPSIWEGSKSEVITHDDTEDNSKKPVSKISKAASSDDETDEEAEKDAFTEKLQNFMEENGTPIIRNPILGNQDLDLHKLYSLVIEAGGMEEVTKQQQWRNIYSKMGIAIMPPSASHHIKMAYKKYLQSFEVHEMGGITGSSAKDSDEEKPEIPTPKNGRTRHERNSKTSRQLGTEKVEKTSLDKRAKSISVEKAEEKPVHVKPVVNKSRRSSTPNKPVSKPDKPVVPSTTPNKPANKQVTPVTTPNKPANKPQVPNKLPLSSISTTLPNKQATTPTGKTTTKSSISKQTTPNKPSVPDKIKEMVNEGEKEEIKVESENGEALKSIVKDVLKQDDEHEDEQRSMKHQDSIESDIDVDEEVTSPESELAVDVVNSPGGMSDTSESRSDTRSEVGTDDTIECTVGDKIQVKYGRGRNRRLYEAKVVTVDPDAEEGLLYLIHYTGWNIRYDEWISPDRIVCKSNKQSKKKGGGTKEFQRSKLPPKPLGKQYVRSLSKRATKSPPPATSNGKTSDTKTSHGNGNKNSPRNSPSPPQTESSVSSPSSSNSTKPQTKGNTPTRRTRSERSSVSSVSNGLEEAIKCQPSKRRQKSLTPEPTDKQCSDKLKESTSSTSSSEGTKDSLDNYNEVTEPQIKKENEAHLGNKGQVDLGNSLSSSTSKFETSKLDKSVEQNSMIFATNKPWSKLPNGLTNYSSSESESPEHSASDNDIEPASKKIKLEKEKDLETKSIKRLLNEDLEHKTPVMAPHSQGSISSEEQEVCVSAEDEEERGKEHMETDCREKSDSSPDNKGNSRAGSSGPESGKEESSNNVLKEEIKSEKKDGDHRNKRHRKKKERKKHRRHSVNDNNSDAPASPNVAAHSPSSKPSPTRPKISFDAELESIKSMEDGSERIRLLKLKINEMRKLYGSLKAEVASIDRKRKKLKKKREEDAASSSHESNSKPNSNHVPSSPVQVECR